MESLFSSPSSTIASILAFSVSLYFLWWISRRNHRKAGNKKAAPKAGGAWPIIGHLHLLGGTRPTHRVLGDMADRYGPIFTINIGVHRTLVVSSWEMAKECLGNNDQVFANRPKSVAGEILTYDGAMFGFSQYGHYWRQVRKIATLELLSHQRLEMLRGVRESEVRTSLRELYNLWSANKSNSNNKVLVEMKGWFGDISLNVILRSIVGKSVGYSTSTIGSHDVEGWKQGLRDFFDFTGMFLVSDALPFLRFLDIGGHERDMKKTAKELDNVVEEWLKEHKQKRANSSGSGIVKEEVDFMDLILNILNDGEGALDRDADTINKATCLALILAASDTTAISLTWALSLLIENPDILRKAQLELDSVVGKDRLVQESDLKNLGYLKAILKESQRLYPAAPLSLPHLSMEDCTVGDYHVPKGTRLLTNIWKIQRDPRVWADPGEFQPERFLTTHKDIDVRGQNFEFMPFSGGRRMCPGVSFALQVIQLTLATLLHGLDFSNPSGEPVDMTEGIGLTNPKATPLEVFISPRLPCQLYQLELA